MNNLNAILEEHHNTGAHGRRHLRMNQRGLDHMLGLYLYAYTAPDTTPREPDMQILLMGIPIVVDELVPAGRWKLVDNHDHAAEVADGELPDVTWPTVDQP